MIAEQIEPERELLTGTCPLSKQMPLSQRRFAPLTSLSSPHFWKSITRVDLVVRPRPPSNAALTIDSDLYKNHSKNQISHLLSPA